MKECVIGIDTSAYTTSLCVTNKEDFSIVYEKRKILDVPLGKRGLRQNSAVFQHMKNLPYFIEEFFSRHANVKIHSIAVSDRPRPIAGSYMPVFFAGFTYARVLAASLSVPLYLFSHQEGHIAAGVGTLDKPIESKQFLAIHISGGTSEICLINRANRDFQIQYLGGTKDLHAGQFVDRIGVQMGLSFPAGAQMEKLALEASSRVLLPSSVQGYDFSFSGPATKAERLVEQGTPHPDIARGIEHCIAKTLEKMIRKAKEDYAIKDVLIVGGVASNGYIREYISQRLNHRSVAIKAHFAKKEYSSDNAYGTALLGIYKQFYS